MTDLAGPGVRVLLIGTGHYPEAGDLLPDIPVVEATLAALRDTLIERCGADPAAVTTLFDPPNGGTVSDAVMAAAAEAGRLLLIYYVGHGLLGPDASALHLATSASTGPGGNLHSSALAFRDIADKLAVAPAAAIVILDCCFSGSARLDNSGYRRFLIASAGRSTLAVHLPDEPYTAFSGRLIRLLREGDPRGPRTLTLGYLVDHLRRVLADDALPAPHYLGGDGLDRLALADNPVYQVPSAPLVLAGPPPGAVEQASPYPGLAPYDIDMARYFFGRRTVVEELTRRVTDGRAVLLLGASGSGKSSVLRAGLLHEARQGRLSTAGGRWWAELLVVPGQAPLARLAAAAGELTGLSPERLRDDLAAHPPGGLGAVLRAHLDQAGARLLLIVDQFEDVFAATETEQAAFIDAVLPETGSGMVTVLGMRADFTGHCSSFRALAELSEHPLVLRPMTEADLREAITGPAREAGLALQDGLADLLLQEMRTADGRPASVNVLPQLSHALLGTWRKQTGGVLTIDGYRATGGIAEAITRTARTLYDSLDADRQAEMRRLVLLMIQIVVNDANGDLVLCRRTPRAELLANSPDPALTREVIGRLDRARLITIDRDEMWIVHDLLVRDWDLLVEATELNREWLLRHVQLTADAGAWDAAGRRADDFYTGQQLDRGLSLIEGREGVPPLVRDYLIGADRHRVETGRRERVNARRLRRFAAAVTVLAVLAGSSAVVAYRQRAEAVKATAEALRQRDVARSAQLAGAAQDLAERQPGLARQLAAVSYRIAHTPEAHTALMAMVAQPAAVDAGMELSNVASRPDGEMVAVSGRGKARLWDPTSRTWLATLDTGSKDRTVELAFLPGDHVLAVTLDARMVVWSIADPWHPTLVADHSAALAADLYDTERLRLDDAVYDPRNHLLAVEANDTKSHTSRLVLADLSSPPLRKRVAVVTRPFDLIKDMAFSPDGRRLALAAYSGETLLWDTARPATPKRLATIDYGAFAMHAVAFSPDGALLATGDGNIPEVLGGEDTVRLWDIRDPRHPVARSVLRGHTNYIYSLAFDPRGRYLVSGGNDSSVHLWDVADPANATAEREMAGHADAVGALAFTAAGQLISASDDFTMRIWDAAAMAHPEELTRFTAGDGRLNDVTFSPDRRTLAVSGRKVTSLWDVADPRHPVRRQVLRRHRENSEVNSATWSPDGSRLFTAGDDGRVISWRAATGSEMAYDDGFRPDEPSKMWQLKTSPDGRLLLTSGRHPRLWDIGGAQRRRLADLGWPDEGSFTKPVDIDVSGTRAVVGRMDGSVRLYDITTPAAPVTLADLPTQRKDILSVTFSPDGRTLATAGGSFLEHRTGDRTVQLWDVSRPRQPRLIATLGESRSQIDEVRFSPDGGLLAAAGQGGSVLLWDVSHPAEPRLLRTFTPHSGIVSGVDFGADGLLAAATWDGQVIFWDTDPERLIRRICDLPGDPITEAQWAQFVPGLPYRPPCAP